MTVQSILWSILQWGGYSRKHHNGKCVTLVSPMLSVLPAPPLPCLLGAHWTESPSLSPFAWLNECATEFCHCSFLSLLSWVFFSTFGLLFLTNVRLWRDSVFSWSRFGNCRKNQTLHLAVFYYFFSLNCILWCVQFPWPLCKVIWCKCVCEIHTCWSVSVI